VRKRALTVLALLAAALMSLLGGAVPAVAAPSPTAPSQAARPGITVTVYELGFNQVSCSAAADCLGLGLAVNPKTLGAQVTLGWNGTTWRKLAVPSPAKGASGVGLTGVSCARQAGQPTCVAVGDYGSKSGHASMFAVTWTGRALRLLPAPRLPRGVTGAYLSAVSCVSARHCVAVGAVIAAPGGAAPLLFETWNGTAWTATTRALPAAGDSAVVNGLSCATASDCVLAGGLETRNGKQSAYAARWTGASLARLAVPAPARTASPMLTAVSCPSTTACAVTGLDFSSATGAAGLAFTDILRHGTWSLAKVGWPTGTTTSELLGLSCLSATWCMAAGNIGGAVAVLVYNGRSWSVQHLPAPAKGYADYLGGVSCVTQKSCVALGDIGPVKKDQLDPLGARWQGRAWTLTVIRP
jgi:hypothetical protein